MPPNNRLRLDDENGVQHSRNQPVQPDQQKAVEIPQPNAAAMTAVQYDELLAEKQIFRLQPHLPREPRAEYSQQPAQKRDHP